MQRDEEFFRIFDWVRCLRCLVPVSRDRQMIVLSCRHTFCSRCFRIGRRIDQWMVSCITCGRRCKFTTFSENLPAAFLEPFAAIKPDMDLFRFKENQMISQIKRMEAELEAAKANLRRKEDRLRSQQRRTVRLKQECRLKYRQALKNHTPAQIKHLLSLPREKIRTTYMRRRYIDEFSPTPLLYQVLKKNASSYSSGGSSTDSFFTSR